MNLGLIVSSILLAADSTSNSATSKTTNTKSEMDGATTCLDGQEEEEEEGIFVLEQKHRTALLSENDELFDSVLSEKIRETYHRLGYVLIRGLFDEDELKDMSHAEEQFLSSQEQEQKPNSSFSSLEFGPIFHSSQTKNDNDDDEDVFQMFRHVSMESTIAPLIAKILFRLDDHDDDNLRILNDVVLAKDGTEDSFCGWHVDDSVFWPCSAQHQDDQPSGVNAWIAMNDIPSKTNGGGMAISPSTHRSNEWIQQAYHAIGSTMTFPKEGIDGIQLMTNIRKTCTLSENAPELYEKFEANKKEFDFQKGDVLLMDRWLWHRSVQSKKSSSTTNRMCLRYTIRYEVGTTTFLNGFTAHPVELHDETLKGKTLNDICTLSKLPFFPKVWPRHPMNNNDHEEEKQQMKRLQSLLPVFKEKKMAIFKELFENAPNNKK